jgi:hypothetical protein
VVAVADETQEPKHEFVGGSKGGPGECGARCRCGVSFDGFDTVAEAHALLDEHIADEAHIVECRELGDREVSRAVAVAAEWTEWAEQLDQLLDAMPDRPGVMWATATGGFETVELGTDHLDERSMARRLAIVRGQADALAAAYSRGADKAAAGTTQSLRVLRGETAWGDRRG